jgi:hypothetical protein
MMHAELPAPIVDSVWAAQFSYREGSSPLICCPRAVALDTRFLCKTQGETPCPSTRRPVFLAGHILSADHLIHPRTGVQGPSQASWLLTTLGAGPASRTQQSHRIHSTMYDVGISFPDPYVLTTVGQIRWESPGRISSGAFLYAESRLRRCK